MLLQQGQKLVVAGGFDDDRRDKAYSIMQGQAPVPEPSLDSNHEEIDSRVWLHAFGSKMSRVLVYSPDTDTYHIGLPLQELFAGTEIIVQLSPSPAAGSKNYAKEAANLLANLKADFSQWMAYIVSHNRCVNTTGTPGKAKAIDMALEHHNLIIKNALRSSGANLTEHHLRVISLAAPVLHEAAGIFIF